MFWRTGCIGCGPTCGGRRRRSEPEASTAGLAGKTLYRPLCCRFLCANNSGSAGHSTPPRWPVPPNSRPCRSGVRGSLAFSFHLGRCGGAGAAVGRSLCRRARRAGTPRTPGGLHALRPKGFLCPAADTAGPSWRRGGSPQRQQRLSGSRSNGAPQPEARPRAPPTEPSGSLFQRSLPRQQQARRWRRGNRRLS